MANETTKIADIINPQVMADMISAKVEKKIVVAPFAQIDTTLVGVPGNTITVPQYAYIGDAEDIAEGVAAETVKLTASTTTATVKKAMKAVELTDEAILSGYGNPVGEANNQIAKAIASKLDNDAIEAITNETNVQLKVGDGASSISYNGIVDAIDLFDEEVQSEKAMFVNPKQVTELRKDSNFISADKYNNDVVMKGEIGLIAGTRIVPSKKVKSVTEYELTSEVALDSSATYYTRSGNEGAYVYTKVTSPDVNDIATYYEVSKVYYLNPIIKLNNDEESEEDAAALTIYLKRDTNVETDRVSLARKTDVSADKHYAVALSNTSKVVLAKFKKA